METGLVIFAAAILWWIVSIAMRAIFDGPQCPYCLSHKTQEYQDGVGCLECSAWWKTTGKDA